MVEPATMVRTRSSRPRSWLVVFAALGVAIGAGACSGGNDGPVAWTGEPRGEEPAQNIVEVLAEDPEERFSTLLELVAPTDDEDATEAEIEANEAIRNTNEDIVEALTGTGPVTVFAPTNEAFEALGTDVDDLTEDPELLSTVLATHVADVDVSFATPPYVAENGLVDGRIEPSDYGLVILEDRSGLVDALSGVSLVVDGTVSPPTVGVRGGGDAVEVIDEDIQAPNGFIQVIDGVIIPPVT